MPSFLYILQSEVNHRHYIGSTRDIRRRLAEHARGQTRSTRAGAPWAAICIIEFPASTAAAEVERFLKRLKSRAAVESLVAAVSSHGVQALRA